MKFSKVFRGVPDGEIFPVEYQPGDACPPELVDAANEVEALEVEHSPTSVAEAGQTAAAKSVKTKK